MQAIGIKSVRRLGQQNSIDFEVNSRFHNFYAEGLVTSNSHAVSYSAMAALTVFYKFNYPKEFFLALLRMAKHESDSLTEIAAISRDMGDFGIELLPPDLNKSGEDFELEGNNIRFGLSAIKGISTKIMSKFSGFKDKHASRIDLFLSAKQAGISIGVLSALIQAGAIESLHNRSRSYMVLEAQTWNILKDREKLLVKDLIESGECRDVLSCIKKLNEEIKNDKGMPQIKDSRFSTIKRDYEKYKSIYLMNSRNEDLANYFYEKELLGRSYSQSLSSIFSKKCEKLMSIKEFQEELNPNEKGLIVGVVSEKVSKTSSKGNPYIKYTIHDESAQIDCFIFSTAHSDKIGLIREDNGGKLPEEKDIVVLKGMRKDETACYVDKLGIQSSKIFMKLKDLKDAEETSDENS